MSYLSPDVYQPRITEADMLDADAAGDGEGGGSTIFLPIITTGSEAPPLAVFDPGDEGHREVVHAPFEAFADIANAVGKITEEIGHEFASYALTAQPDSPPPTATPTPEAEIESTTTKEPTGLAKLVITWLMSIDQKMAREMQLALEQQKYPFRINLPLVSNGQGRNSEVSTVAAESDNPSGLNRGVLALLALLLLGVGAGTIKRN